MLADLEEWRKALEELLTRKTGRKDIEVTAGPYRNYDVHVSKAKRDHHPIIDFHSAMRWDPVRVRNAVDYATRMCTNWEAQNVIHGKAFKDSERFFAMLKARFPDLEMDYAVIDSERHYVHVNKVKETGKLFASFDLWPTMTDAEVEKIASFIQILRGDIEKRAGMAGFDY
jgi:hypothetical protein